MDTIEKLRLLGSDPTIQSERDTPPTPYVSLRGNRRGNTGVAGVSRAAVPGRGCIPLLSVLMTNVCELNCRYCSINCHRNVRRTSFKPQELVTSFTELHRRGTAGGLFLSSGVAGGPARTQERMLETVALLRRSGYRGYVHLKLMPGISSDYIEEAARLADRLSVNLEAPTPGHLGVIAPAKDFHNDLLAPMRAVSQIKEREPHLMRAGQVSQLVVGGAGDADRQILATARQLYGQMGMRRVYYSPYHPVCGEVLAPPAPIARAHRLYQADWLMRFYGIPPDELLFDDHGNLPLAADPKLVWALRHQERFPLEVNRAPYRDLLLVPGIGPLSARRIVQARRQRSFRNPTELAAVGVVTKRACHFLLVDGRFFGGRGVMLAQLRQAEDLGPRQLSLWETTPQPVLA